MYNSEILKANAKINLALLVGDRIPPLYFHSLESLIVRITLHDTLEINTNFNKNVESCISISCKFDQRLETHILASNLSPAKLGLLIESEQGIIYKTCRHILDTIGEQYPGLNIDVRIIKSIPLEAGLGGGSADAASILNFFSKYFSLPANKKLQIADNVGFDVGPCLFSEPTYSSYYGQNKTIPLTKSQPFLRRYVLVLKPPIGLSTELAYKSLGRKKVEQQENSKVYFSETEAENFLKKVMCKSEASRQEIIKNDFQDNAFTEIPELENVLSNIEQFNPILSGLAGSGSSIFSIFEDYQSALKAYKAHIQIAKKGWFLAITEILSL